MLILGLCLLAFSGVNFALGEYGEFWMGAHKFAGFLVALAAVLHVINRKKKLIKLANEFIDVVTRRKNPSMCNMDRIIASLEPYTIAQISQKLGFDETEFCRTLRENGVKFRVVIDEYNDGKKVFDYYSDRNFVDYQQDRRGLARTFDPHSRVQVPSATNEIISQKGNLVNEETKANGLRDSVSSVGDNASRTGGRQTSDEQILRQGRRDTANASQTKRAAQSDEQMERQWTAKADGEADAAAATKQVVEKQGSGANIGGRLAANSNAHLGSGLVAGSLNSIDEDGNFSPERFAAGFLAGLAGE